MVLTWTEAVCPNCGQDEAVLVDMAAAVDALTSRQDTPTDTDTDNPPTETASPQATAGGQADTTAVGCVLTTDRDMQAFVELPDCPACDGCGKQVPADWRGEPDELDPDPSELAEVTAERDRALKAAGDLSGQLEQARREFGEAVDRQGTARRDGAADALEDAAADNWGGEYPEYYLRELAAEIRAGQRDVPGGERG